MHDLRRGGCLTAGAASPAALQTGPVLMLDGSCQFEFMLEDMAKSKIKHRIVGSDDHTLPYPRHVYQGPPVVCYTLKTVTSNQAPNHILQIICQRRCVTHVNLCMPQRI